MKLSDYDFSDLKNYPNVGIRDQSKKEIGKLNYGKNYKIRSYTQKIALTEEAKKEREKCYSDPVYMIEEYVKLFQVGKGVQNIKLWDHQKEYIKSLENDKLILALFARRLAKSTTAYMIFIHRILSRENYHIGIAVNNDKLKKATSKAVKAIFESLPPFLQQGVVKYNMSEIVLENGSSIEFTLISGDTFRGEAKDFVMADELDFADQANDFFDSVDPIISEAPEVQFLITTTPNGKHVMYKLWNDSIKGKNDFKRLKYTWEARPDRDEKWFQNELQKKGELYVNRNHLCSFEGSSATLINNNTLRKIEDNIIKEPIDVLEDHINIYEEPVMSHHITYVIGVDTSKISATAGDDPDSISFQVIKVDTLNLRFKQVAVMKTEDIHYTESGEMLKILGEYYSDITGEPALIIIENNSGDGQSIADNLGNTLEYEHLFYEENRDDIWGVRTTKKTKPIMLKNLKWLLEHDILELVDEETYDQLSKFIKSKTSYEASPGEHDDCVMALAIAFFWLLDDENEFEITINEIKESLNSEIVDVEVEEDTRDEPDMISSKNNELENWLL
jgi:hypothetical protein